MRERSFHTPAGLVHRSRRAALKEKWSFALYQKTGPVLLVSGPVLGFGLVGGEDLGDWL